MYVDLNGKQAFPIDELPQTPPDAEEPPPPSPPGNSAPPANAGAATTPHETVIGAPPNAARGQAVLRGAAFVMCELPLWTGRAVSERLVRHGNGAAQAAESTADGTAAAVAEAAPAAAAAAHASADTVAVPLGDVAAAADAIPEHVRRDRKQWFENIPATAMPLVAVQPDAQLCLCRLDSQTPLSEASETPARHPSSTHGEDADPAESMHAVAWDMVHGGGPAERTNSHGQSLASEYSAGGSTVHAPVEGAELERFQGTDSAALLAEGSTDGAASEGEDAQLSSEGEEGTPQVLYFFKADVSRGDFAHTAAAEVKTRSWTGGILQGLSGWLTPGTAALSSSQRKAGWGIGAASCDWDAAAASERSFKTMLRSRSENIAALSVGAADGGDAGGETSRRGKGSSSVLEGVWLALGGRTGSRPLDGGEEAAREVEGLRGLSSAWGSVGRGPASVALVDAV